MNNSGIVTASSVTAAMLAAPIKWYMDGCPHPVPEGVALCFAAILIPIGYGFYSLLMAWLKSKTDAIERADSAVTTVTAEPEGAKQ